MPISPSFARIRNVAFLLITSASFLFIIGLCVVVFCRWTVCSDGERGLLIVFLISNVLTCIMMPLLITSGFKPYIDAARMALLLMIHIGLAVAFAYWDPYFSCPGDNINDQGTCSLINLFILLASWVVPTLLILYTIALGLMAYRRARMPPAEDAPSKDLEAIPVVDSKPDVPFDSASSFTSRPDEVAAKEKHMSQHTSMNVMNTSNKRTSEQRASLPASSRTSLPASSRSARNSRPLPPWY